MSLSPALSPVVWNLATVSVWALVGADPARRAAFFFSPTSSLYLREQPTPLRAIWRCRAGSLNGHCKAIYPKGFRRAAISPVCKSLSLNVLAELRKAPLCCPSLCDWRRLLHPLHLPSYELPSPHTVPLLWAFSSCSGRTAVTGEP